MLGRRFISFLRRSPSVSGKGEAAEGKAKTWGRRIVSLTLILTGGVALSVLGDISIYHSCSSAALERASKNKRIIDAIGEPIVRGPWYDASLAIAHQTQSVSCIFPVSGPKGTGIFRLKAVGTGEDKWSSFLRPTNWDILIMEAIVHVPGNGEQTFWIKVSDDVAPPASSACADCTSYPESSCKVDKN